MIKCFVLDSMHLVFLGVTKRFLKFLSTRKTSTLSNALVAEISERLKSYRGLLPSDFVRQPRPISDLAYWKATEFRSFIMYTGVVALRDVLSHEAYEHFLSLSIAIYILSDYDDVFRNRLLNYAKSLLQYYVSNSELLIHTAFPVYNVHNLLHLVDDVKNYNLPITEISAFPFENFLQRMKRFVKGKRFPLQEMLKRHDEWATQGHPSHKAKELKISCSLKDSCFRTEKGIVFLTKKEKNNEYRAVLYKYELLQEFYKLRSTPSQTFGTYYISSYVVGKNVIVNIDSLVRKCVVLPYDNGRVIMTLCHGLY